jgi:hypothetical protein
MNDCRCGKPVRLATTRIRVNRRLGIMHHIEHTDGEPMHGANVEWSCVMMKPYPKHEADRPYTQMIERWNASSPPHE